MNEVRFTVPGWTRGKARPRSRIINKKDGKSFISTYTPPATGIAEGSIKYFAREAMAGRPLMEGPIEFRMCVYSMIPDSWSGKKKAAAMAGKILPTAKPDYDNLGKLVSDAINLVVYKDDAQIVTAQIFKRYSDKPRLSVIVKQVEL